MLLLELKLWLIASTPAQITWQVLEDFSMWNYSHKEFEKLFV